MFYCSITEASTKSLNSSVDSCLFPNSKQNRKHSFRFQCYTLFKTENTLSAEPEGFSALLKTFPRIIRLRLRDTPRPLTSKQKWLPEQNTRSIALVGLAEYSAAYPIRAETALRLQQKRWLDALP